jgi:hypothetical protein
MMVAAKDMFCQMMTMMTMPLMVPFVCGILFGMHLVNSQETQVVCCKAHPCLDGHTVVAILLEMMKVAALVITIKAVSHLNSFFITQPRILPFISKPREIGGCVDGGHDSAAGPTSSGDNDGTAPCSLTIFE